ncbi:MAG: YkvA family protein [Anaerolineae bacterium]
MPDDKMQYPERVSDVNTLLGWLKDFFGQFRLAWELLWDGRVPLVNKIIPILTLLYVISPVDLVPGMAVPGLGQLDDLAIFLIGMRLFVDVCPPALVAEHQKEARLEMTAAPAEEERPTSSTWRIPSSGQIIDLEAEEVSDTDATAEDKPKPPLPHVW